MDPVVALGANVLRACSDSKEWRTILITHEKVFSIKDQFMCLRFGSHENSKVWRIQVLDSKPQTI